MLPATVTDIGDWIQTPDLLRRLFIYDVYL